MDPNIIVALILAVAALIGLPLALLSRKKAGPKKVEELNRHLQIIGLKASLLVKDVSRQKMERNALGIITLTDRNIDSINVVGVATQYGVQYYIDYHVSTSGSEDKGPGKKTRMTKKRSSAFMGKVIDIEWKGDDSLAHRLNLDYQLKDRLLLSAYKGNIEISSEPKYGYVKIRTVYTLPDRDFFEAMDAVARHIKWG